MHQVLYQILLLHNVANLTDNLQGWEILYCEFLEKDWKEKFEEFSKHAKGELEARNNFQVL